MMAKKVNPSIKAAKMIAAPRMLPAASGWRAIPSIAVNCIHPRSHQNYPDAERALHINNRGS
jgi:hypothetical protein